MPLVLLNSLARERVSGIRLSLMVFVHEPPASTTSRVVRLKHPPKDMAGHLGRRMFTSRSCGPPAAIATVR